MEEFPRLTDREWEVLQLLFQGKSNKQIAWELSISERTVEFHLRNIYVKFGVGSRIELILKLGKLTGNLDVEKLGQSTVTRRVKIAENQVKLNQLFGWAKSIFGKEIRMKQIGFQHPLGGVLAALLGSGLWVVWLIASASLAAEDFRGVLGPFLLLVALSGGIVGWFGAIRSRSLHHIYLSTLVANGITPLFILPLMCYVVVPVGRVIAGFGLLDLATMPAKTASDLAAAIMLGFWFGLSVLFGVLFQRISIHVQVNGAKFPIQREA